MRYIVGADSLSGVYGFEVKQEYIENTKCPWFFIVTRKTDLGDFYYWIRTALKEDKSNVYLIVADTIDSTCRQLCMLMLTYGSYNIYSTESVDDIDDEYIEAIEGREATIEEIGIYFGKDMETYPSAGEMLTEIVRLLRYSDVESVVKYVSDNREKIKSMSGLLDYMKKVIDELSLMVHDSRNEAVSTGNNDAFQKKVDELRADLGRAELEAKVTKGKNEELITTVNDQTAEIARLKEEIESIRNTKSKAAVIRDYMTLDVNKFKNSQSLNARTPRIKEILYFKEINPCSYISTFITMLQVVLTQIDMIDSRVLIFDEDKFSNVKYKPLRVINSEQYESDREKIAKANNTMVVTEPAVSILADALVDNECLIIYDRLGGEADLLSGKDVHKYWVVNSLKDIHALESVVEVDKKRVITNVGVSKSCWSIRTIKNFKEMTLNAKLSAYLHMTNMGEDTRPVIDAIIQDSKLSRISRREQKI